MCGARGAILSSHCWSIHRTSLSHLCCDQKMHIPQPSNTCTAQSEAGMGHSCSSTSQGVCHNTQLRCLLHVLKAGFTMVPRKGMGTRMGLLQQMCTGHLLCVLNHLEAAGALALMFYALLWEVGNLVNLPDKRIGFYNFCLWNETAGELQCLDYKHLQVMGISQGTMQLATVCVYICPVLSIFYPLFVAHVKCTEKKEGWKGIRIILIIETILLLGGLGTFLSQTSQWIHTSDFTGGFLALLGTLALLLLQILTTTMYLWWAKLMSEPSCQEVQIEMSQ